MAVKLLVFVLMVFLVRIEASESWDNAGMKIALKVYDECSKSDGFSPCLKKKAITFFSRLGRMDKLSITDELEVVKTEDTAESALTDEDIEKNLPRDLNAKEEALDTMLYDKITTFVSSRTLRFTMPKLSSGLLTEEGRGKKMKGMMGSLMMGIAGKMAAMIPIAIAGLFLLAGKALITAKIALLLAGIIAIKKLVAAKQGGGGGGGGGGHGGWQSGGGHGGWNSGGGWDKRSLDAQPLAYKAYVPQ